MPTLFQAGTLIGLSEGVYDGDVDFKTLAQHGDIGLGTFNGLDGEMIALDGNFYRIGAEGAAELVDPDVYTPFAMVTKFKAAHSFVVENIKSLTELNTVLDQHIDTQNIFYMMRIDADFNWIKFRSESCPMHSSKLAPETLLHSDFELHHVTGSLVLTRCPNYSGALTISGYHHHFIDHAKAIGGHVFDLNLKKGKVMITPLRRFSMVLSQNKSFDEANLGIDIKLG